MIEHLRVIGGNRFIAGVMKAALDAIRERLRGRNSTSEKPEQKVKYTHAEIC
jgi:hypothetical protein